MRERGGRKRALGTRAPMSIPQGANLRLSLDFVMDTLVSGRRFRILTVVDDFTRECLGLVVDNSLPALRVARELKIIEAWRIDYNTNRPHTSLNGLTPTEFAARPREGHNQNRLSL